MGFLFDLPLILTGPLLIAVLVGFSLVSLTWFRNHQSPRLRFGDTDVEFGAAMLASIMVFYALATALTAVQVWESYDEAKEITEHEASSGRSAPTPIRSSTSPSTDRTEAISA